MANQAHIEKLTQTMPWFRRLTVKFVAIAFFLVAIPQIILYFYSSNTASEMLIESLKSDLQEKAFLVGADIDRFIDQRVHDVIILSQADVLEGADNVAIIQYLTEIVEATPYLDDIDIVEIDGTISASSGEQNEQGQNILKQQPSMRHIWFDVLAAAQGDIYISDILSLDNGAGLAFLTPITDDSNVNVIKVLLVEINLDIIKKIVADFDERVIGDKFVYLVDNDGRVIVTADPEVTLLAPFPDLVAQPDLLNNFSLQGDVGNVIYQDAKGEQVMAGYADMAEFGNNKAMDWSIIAVAPMADITRPVASFQNALLVMTTVFILIAGFVMFLIGRNIVGSVARLVEGSDQVGAGDTDHRIQMKQNDEFGYLARSINNTLDQLMSAQATADTATTTKSDFLAAMSHEIRTPMAGIIGMADLILEGDLDPKVQERVTSIKSSGNHLMKILNEILDQSKLDAGKIVIDSVDFHIASFIKQVSELFRPKIVSKGLTLTIDIDEAVSEGARADPFRITQVLTNLLSNALKFAEKGDILVHVEQEETVEGKIFLKFAIIDNGIGLSPEAQESLFSPFVQADSSTSRTYGGTGLGLSISKQLVELMGGEIGVSSVKGVGSKFWFTVEIMPTQGKLTSYDTEVVGDKWQANRALKILVAEDTDYLQELIRTILVNLGHEVTIVANGKLAVKAVQEQDFELILMDIRMPVMDGLEATTLIRSLKDNKSIIPIIAITADVTSSNVGEYLKKGMNHVCSKPIDLPDLLNKINKVVGEEVHTK